VAAAAVAEEKDRHTLPILLTTTLSDREIVFGKAAARVALVLSAVFAGLPVLMLTLLFGGVDLGLVAAGYALTAGTVALCAAIGVYAACRAPDLRSAILRASVGTAALVAAPLLLLAAFVEREPPAALPLFGCAVPLAQLLAAAGLLLAAARALRLREATAGPRPATAYPEPPRPADPPLLRPTPVPPPQLPPIDEADPVLWKERCAGWRPDWSLPVAAKVLAVTAAVLAVALLLWGGWVRVQRVAQTLDPVEAERLAQAADTGGWLLMGAGVCAAGRYLFPLAVGVSGAVAGERRRGTLDALLSTTLDRRAILRAKVRAHAERGAVFGGIAAVALGMAFVAGGVQLGLAAMALCAGGIALVLGLGAWLSVRCVSDLRAFRLLQLVVALATGWPAGAWSLFVEAQVPAEVLTRWLLVAAGACAATGLVLWWRAGAELERGE
jgi:ABC-type Na+ efflux pump permease subunit